MTIAQRLELLKSEIAEMERQQIQAETRLESLHQQKKDIYAECKALGLNPEELDSEVERLSQELEAGILEIENLLRPTPGIVVGYNLATQKESELAPW